MTKRLFLFENHGNKSKHKLIKLEEPEAAALINQGKAVEVELTEYDKLAAQADKLCEEYDKKRERIRKSDDPRLSPEIKEYDLQKAYEELEQQTKELQRQWDAKRAEMEATARAKSAQAVVKVTDNDRQVAEQVANRIKLSIVQATDETDLNVALDRAGEDVGYLTDAQKTALQGDIANVVMLAEQKAEQVGGKAGMTSLLSAVESVKNLDLFAEKVAAQLPTKVSSKFNQIKLIRNNRV